MSQRKCVALEHYSMKLRFTSRRPKKIDPFSFINKKAVEIYIVKKLFQCDWRT